MTDRAVFFDPTSRRWWWVKRIVTLLGMVSTVAVSVWLVSLFTAPLLPGIDGITIPIRRAMRRSLRFPRHYNQLQQFLLKKETGKLLAEIQKDLKPRLARAALPPVKAPRIVAPRTPTGGPADARTGAPESRSAGSRMSGRAGSSNSSSTKINNRRKT